MTTNIDANECVFFRATDLFTAIDKNIQTTDKDLISTIQSVVYFNLGNKTKHLDSIPTDAEIMLNSISTSRGEDYSSLEPSLIRALMQCAKQSS